MLGLIFTEFIEMVEDRFSAETADAMLAALPDGHDGAFTSVGYYPHEDLVALIVRLSSLTALRVEDILRTFGRHLAERFAHLYPALFQRHTGLFDILAAVDGEIHVEVRKLYSQATLPRFEVLERSERHMKLLYRSPRHLESLVLGMIEQLAVRYRQPCRIDSEPWSSGDVKGTAFHLTLPAA